MNLDLRCYLVTAGVDATATQVAQAAAGAGCGIIQIRAKQANARDFLQGALALSEAVYHANPDTRVLINDRCDIAWAAMQSGGNIHGVHLGQEDLPVAQARQLLGPAAIIGLTTGTLELVEQANAQAELLNYIGAGPFRPTPTKNSGRPALGVQGYTELCQVSALPIVAIGGITAADVPALAAQGVAGVAMVREFVTTQDIGALLRTVHAAFLR